MFLFIAFYWFMSVRSNLNIGVRHLIPTLPFAYVLIAGQIIKWFGRKSEIVSPILVFWHQIKSLGKSVIIWGALLWMFVNLLLVYPGFLSFFNELAGGTDNGYKIAVDSNYDWGQDLKRLKNYVEENNINQIKIDYFGGGNPEYYLGDKFIPWWASRGETTGWLAVSLTFFQDQNAMAVKGYDQPTDQYKWLNKYTPTARAGKSIFIYNIK